MEDNEVQFYLVIITFCCYNGYLLTVDVNVLLLLNFGRSEKLILFDRDDCPLDLVPLKESYKLQAPIYKQIEKAILFV